MKKVCPQCETQFETSDDVLECPHDRSILMALPDEPPVGTQIAHYKILALVGKGGMGNVFRARHTLLDRDVAIKMLHPHLVADPQMLMRFQTEARAVSSLIHPNIVAAREFAMTSDGQPYFVMDFVEGISLSTIIRKQGILNWDRFMAIFAPVCDALSCAHAHGIIHRDIKPGNIIVTTDPSGNEYARLVDFGIAKMQTPDGESLSLTQTGDVIGSPLYMSPEQCLCRKLDRRTDIYSLGCVMYEAVTGEAPFRGGSAYETIFQHVHEAPKPFNSVCARVQVRPELETLVFQMLSKDPDERSQSSEEVLEGLRLIDQGKKVFQKVSPVERRAQWKKTLQVAMFTALVLTVLSGIVVAILFPETFAETSLGWAIGGVFIVCGAGLIIFPIIGRKGGAFLRVARGSYVPPERSAEHNKFLKEYSAPPSAGGLILGSTADGMSPFLHKPNIISLKPALREENPHMLFVGSAGTGKTRLLAHLTAQDLLLGDRAVIAFDGSGDLSDLISVWSSRHLPLAAERVQLLDMGGADSISFNPFKMITGVEPLQAGFFVASAMKAAQLVVQPQSQWTEQTSDMLRDCIALLLATGEPLTKLPEVAHDAIYRYSLIERLPDERRQRALKTLALYGKLIESGEWANNSIPFVQQIEAVSRDRILREALEGPTGLDLKSIVSSRKILLVKLPVERMGSKASFFANLLFTALRHEFASVPAQTHQCTVVIDGMSQLVNPDVLVEAMRARETSDMSVMACDATLQNLNDATRLRLIRQIGHLGSFACTFKDAELLAPIMFGGSGAKLLEQASGADNAYTSTKLVSIADSRIAQADRLVGQDRASYFCYKVGSAAGIVHLIAPEFNPKSDMLLLGARR